MPRITPRAFALAFCFIAPLLAACEPAAPAREVGAESAPIDKRTAIASVKRDVRERYQQDVASVDAHDIGRFWVVEARMSSGLGVRYAISQTDGAIRERSTFQ